MKMSLPKRALFKTLRTFGVKDPHYTVDHKLLGQPYEWSSYPSVIQIDTSNMCGPKYSGVKCVYCFPQEEVCAGRDFHAEMPMEWIKWILCDMGKNWREMQFWCAFLNGDGETDLRLPMILKYARQVVPHVTRETFSCGANPRDAWLLTLPDLDRVCFTVSAHDRGLYRVVHGGDKFDAVVESLRYVQKHHHPNQELQIHYVINKYNFFAMGLWLSWVRRDFPEFKPVFSALVATKDNQPSIRAMGDLTMQQQEDAIRSLVPKENAFWESTRGALRKPCVLWHNASVDVHGRFMQCCCWHDTNKWNYGTVQQFMDEGRSLREYWLARLANKQNNSVCRGCNLRHPDYKKRLEEINVEIKLK